MKSVSDIDAAIGNLRDYQSAMERDAEKAVKNHNAYLRSLNDAKEEAILFIANENAQGTIERVKKDVFQSATGAIPNGRSGYFNLDALLTLKNDTLIKRT